jgi:hypothetical protein
MKRMPDSFYILDISVEEQRGYNVLFTKLAPDRDISQPAARKILSGVRLQSGTKAKVSKHTAQVWLRHWHRLGLVTLIHGRVRLGSPGIYSSVLDEDNKELIRKSVE